MAYIGPAGQQTYRAYVLNIPATATATAIFINLDLCFQDLIRCSLNKQTYLTVNLKANFKLPTKESLNFWFVLSV